MANRHARLVPQQYPTRLSMMMFPSSRQIRTVGRLHQHAALGHVQLPFESERHLLEAQAAAASNNAASRRFARKAPTYLCRKSGTSRPSLQAERMRRQVQLAAVGRGVQRSGNEVGPRRRPLRKSPSASSDDAACRAAPSRSLCFATMRWGAPHYKHPSK